MKKLLHKFAPERNSEAVNNRSDIAESKKCDPATHLLPELMTEIFRNLSFKDLMSANRVNKQWHLKANKDILLKTVLLNDKTHPETNEFLERVAADGKNIRGKLIAHGIQKEIVKIQKNVQRLQSNMNTAQAMGSDLTSPSINPIGTFVNPSTCVAPIFSGLCCFFQKISETKKIAKEQEKISNLRELASLSLKRI